ncbi:MAG: ArsR/SmtB family transcription factor [Ktedonobacteraceae bacterium]
MREVYPTKKIHPEHTDLTNELLTDVPGMSNEAVCIPHPQSTLDYQLAKEASALFAALADPTRLAILKLLLDNHGEACVCDITSNFHLGQPTISHHLKILRTAQLVNTNKRGKWVFYVLEKTHLEQAKQLFATLLTSPNASQE